MKRVAIATAGVVFAVTIAACGVPTDDRPRAIPSDRVPFDLLAPSTTAPATTAQQQNVSIDVYMVKGDRLSAVKRIVAAPPTIGAALAALLQGPKIDTEQGITSAVSGAGVLGAQVNGSMAVVSVSNEFAARQKADQILGLAQIVYTATGISGVQSVQVAVNGTSVEVPRADGILTRDPVRRIDYISLAPG